MVIVPDTTNRNESDSDMKISTRSESDPEDAMSTDLSHGNDAM